MSDRKKPYPFDVFEPEWQHIWDECKTFKMPNPGDPQFDASKPKYYVLDMFPYPSGAGLHVGHPEGYTATDIMARFKRMNGFNVLHPMGWDSFGLPAEQYAIKTGQHPEITTKQNIDNFRRQLKMLGFSYDWDREIATTSPDYVRWTQWIFLKLYNSYYNKELKKACPIADLEAQGLTHDQIDNRRLAYVAEVSVNWSPDLGTVLSNEEVEEWRSKGHHVERRPLRQWMLRITDYAERLIDELEPLDWPESIKLLQRNWIGRSEGAEVDFSINSKPVTVYTTRPDTLFGASYMVLSPEHPFISEITIPEQTQAVRDYQASCANKSDLERTELSKEKTGVFTGAYAINPVNGEQIPVWIADYVMMGYGTGAIMAVPAHDERDFAFAQKFNLPILQVVQPPRADIDWRGFCGYEGSSINSGFLTGMPTTKAKETMIQWLEGQGKGRRQVNYKLRDWLFSRQRYWGEPFPIIWENGRHAAISEAELPLLQPEMEDFKPNGDPRGPLVKATQWMKYSETAMRETNTMPQWAGSCWYYLRYLDPHNTDRFVNTEAERYWMGNGATPGGIDLYVGGTEHAVLHLLYARFWHKVLFDLGYITTPEPFQKLINQGLILGEDGQKMSKSRGNVVNPDDIVHEYGADALRLYEMFMGPLKDVKPWATKGVEGVSRFLARTWRVAFIENQEGQWAPSGKIGEFITDTKDDLTAKMLNVRKELHKTIKKVTADVNDMSFNTALSKMMECTTAMTAAPQVHLTDYVALLTLLNPFAPHITEELYARLKKQFSTLPQEQLCQQAWPICDESLLVEDNITLIVQVNGKMRDKMVVAASASNEDIEAIAKSSEKVQALLQGMTIRKTIVVPGRLVNIVATPAN
ncbi:MAG: leucine--tRNA ligase [Akkermansia sp.]